MNWTPTAVDGCVIAACAISTAIAATAATGVVVGYALRARLERGIRHEYRELFSACRRSMAGASEYGSRPSPAPLGAAPVPPAAVPIPLPLARRDRPVPLPSALLRKRAERRLTTEWIPGSSVRLVSPGRAAPELSVVPAGADTTALPAKKPPPLPTKTHCMRALACEELVLTGGLTEDQRNA